MTPTGPEFEYPATVPGYTAQWKTCRIMIGRKAQLQAVVKQYFARRATGEFNRIIDWMQCRVIHEAYK